MPVDFWKNGKSEKRGLGNALRETFGSLISRISAPHVILFPILQNIFLTPFERDLKENSRILRLVIRDIIRDRQVNPRKSVN